MTRRGLPFAKTTDVTFGNYGCASAPNGSSAPAAASAPASASMSRSAAGTAAAAAAARPPSTGLCRLRIGGDLVNERFHLVNFVQTLQQAVVRRQVNSIGLNVLNLDRQQLCGHVAELSPTAAIQNQ